MISKENTRVTFVTKKETKNALLQLVKEEKADGRKMTLSQYINEILVDHVEFKKFFENELKHYQD